MEKICRREVKTVEKRMLKREDQQKNRGTRELYNLAIREVEGQERTFELSFSSEEPYMRWFGPEILDHSEGAVDLSRLQDIGIVLFNHKRDSIMGRINRVWVENNRGMAEITFDDDDEAEKIYQKVKNKTLKGTSVGYIVDVWEEVAPGKTSSDGRFAGPCSIAKKWTPYEISIVSIPADATVGVGRSDTTAHYETYERQLQVNKEKAAEMTRRRKR